MTDKKLIGIIVIVGLFLLIMNSPNFEFPKGVYSVFQSDPHTSTWKNYSIDYYLAKVIAYDASVCSTSSVYSDDTDLVLNLDFTNQYKCGLGAISSSVSIQIPAKKNGGNLQSIQIYMQSSSTKSRLGESYFRVYADGGLIREASAGNKEGASTISSGTLFVTIIDNQIPTLDGQSINISGDFVTLNFQETVQGYLSSTHPAAAVSSHLTITDLKTTYSSPPVIITPVAPIVPIVNTTPINTTIVPVCIIELGSLCKNGEVSFYASNCSRGILANQGYSVCPTSSPSGASFTEESGALAETTEPIIVLPSKDNSGSFFGISLAVISVFGLGAFLIFRK